MHDIYRIAHAGAWGKKVFCFEQSLCDRHVRSRCSGLGHELTSRRCDENLHRTQHRGTEMEDEAIGKLRDAWCVALPVKVLQYAQGAAGHSSCPVSLYCVSLPSSSIIHLPTVSLFALLHLRLLSCLRPGSSFAMDEIRRRGWKLCETRTRRRFHLNRDTDRQPDSAGMARARRSAS